MRAGFLHVRHVPRLSLSMGTSGVAATAFSRAAVAQVFNGGGLQEGVDAASGVTGIATGDPRSVIINILITILDYVALLAVIMIIVAGFYLILSLGNDEQKDKAKKIILYTIIGLLVILFARLIVSLVTVWLASAVS